MKNSKSVLSLKMTF